MNALCICQYGHSRSVALARVLRGAFNSSASRVSQSYDTVAIGWETAHSALEPLSQWADVIFILERSYLFYVPESYHGKVVVFDVGRDRWSNPYNPELSTLLLQMVVRWEAEGRPLGSVYA
jgi:hypothetical protein